MFAVQYPIHQVARAFELTSRTLRYWEDAGLFQSSRDPQSGWRVYDSAAMQRIRVAALLRQLDVPVKTIRGILDGASLAHAADALAHQAGRLEREQAAVAERRRLLEQCVTALSSAPRSADEAATAHAATYAAIEQALAAHIPAQQTRQEQWEAILVTDNTTLSGALRLVTLPQARMVYRNVISASPEDEALEAVTSWAESAGLLGGARIYGFNTTKYQPGQKEYGWAAGVTVPEGTPAPEHLEETRLPGGIYARLASTNEVYDSWQTLVRLLQEHGEYEMDSSRICLEEHTRNAEPKGQGNEYYIDLLAPVKRK